ncbi:MAG TPA: DUF5818 domain-containing protein [Candidatus Acidoferrales bacterium]|nr:DUF5818 domain-containing protein [Candidatus Acidoferrales bacterium]
MKKAGILAGSAVILAGLAFAAPKPQTFTGAISDSMCGASHMMEGTAKDCTLKCVAGGSAFILVDAKGKIYKLSDQAKPRAFAGENVTVTGTLNGDMIDVASIAAAK